LGLFSAKEKAQINSPVIPGPGRSNYCISTIVQVSTIDALLPLMEAVAEQTVFPLDHVSGTAVGFVIPG